MSGADELVEEWLLSKFFEEKYDPVKHGPADPISVLQVDMDWECGCYSSWTRDDDFVVTAKMQGADGEFEYSYGYWGDFPEWLKELDAYRENNTCSIQNREPWEGDDW